MKKTIFSLMAGLVLALGAASCSENGEDPVPAPTPIVNPDGTQTVVLTANVPEGMRSRAASAENFANGQFIATLYYGIFEGDSKTPIISKSIYTKPVDGKYSISVNLNPQKSYKVMFWAQHYFGMSLWSVDYSGQEHYVDVEKAPYTKEHSEKGDCFYGLFDIAVGKENNFTLTRPVAQISIVTDEDLSAFDLASFKTRVSMRPMPVKYNEVDKGISGSYGTITNNYTTFDGKYLDYNGRQLRYLYVDYVFPTESETELTVMFSDASGSIRTRTITLPNIKENTHYIIMPKGTGASGNEPGGSIIGSDTEIAVVMDTNFTNSSAQEL